MKRFCTGRLTTVDTIARAESGECNVPSSAKSRSQTGSPVASSCTMPPWSSKGSRDSDIGEHAHQIHQPGALRITLPTEIGGARREHGLDLSWAADELGPGGEEGSDDPGDVRRRHGCAGQLRVHRCV